MTNVSLGDTAVAGKRTYLTDASVDHHTTRRGFGSAWSRNQTAVTRSGRTGGPADVLHVVLDDDTIARLRDAAERSGIEIEVEQLIVHVIHLASRRPDEFLVGAHEDS
jgi:hypothetical protein